MGDTVVTITGKFLAEATRVDFGDRRATKLKVLSDDKLVVTAPEAEGDVAPLTGQSPVHVQVTTPFGTNTLGASDRFIYKLALSALRPGSGSTSGGSAVLIDGIGFAGAKSVQFGDTLAGFAILSDTEIAAAVPPQEGAVDIRVVTKHGTTPLVDAGRFSYFTSPGETGPASITQEPQPGGDGGPHPVPPHPRPAPDAGSDRGGSVFDLSRMLVLRWLPRTLPSASYALVLAPQLRSTESAQRIVQLRVEPGSSAQFARPATLDFAHVKPVAVVMTSLDGIHWLPLPLLRKERLPAGAGAGYYRHKGGTAVRVFTLHPAYFGVTRTHARRR